MTESQLHEHGFPTAGEDLQAVSAEPALPHTRSPSYRLAYADVDFLLRDELRSVRLQLELLKPEILQAEQGIGSTVVVFGSARIPEPGLAAKRVRKAEQQLAQHPGDPALQGRVDVARRIQAKSRYYDEARAFARLTTERAQQAGRKHLVVITGGGPGIMEAANRGAHDAGGRSVGLNIVLPLEQQPNPYVTPDLSFQFHYFAIRKLHFLLRAKALVAFPGGYGTLDELFETLTLIQTGKVKAMPVLLFGREFWDRIINFAALAEEGVVSSADLDLFRFVETAEEAWGVIAEHYGIQVDVPHGSGQ